MSAPRPFRILFIDHTAALGGGEIALLNLAKNLDREQYTPLVVLGGEGPLRTRLNAAGIETYVLPLSPSVAHARKDRLGATTLFRMGSASSMLIYVIRLARFIARHQIDLVHTNSLKADVLGGLAARLARRPVVWHVRDRIENDYLPAGVVRAFRALCGIIPNFIIANSRATLRTLRLPSTRRATAISSGIDLGSHSRVVHDGMDASAAGPQRRIDRGTPAIGMVGRISPWKGQHVFLRAAAFVHREFPEARFRIIGAALFDETPYERHLHELVQSLGLSSVVEFAGFRDDVHAAISELDVLVHASTTGEPFGQVVIEAMAAGKPVVATKGGGVPEIVCDGVTGLLVPMGDSIAIASAINRLLDHPELAQGMGERGKALVREKFTITRTVANVQAVYRELLNQVGGRQWFDALCSAPGSPRITWRGDTIARRRRRLGGAAARASRRL